MKGMKNLKNEKGYTVIDIGMAVFVIIIFTAIITSISYNVYSSSTEAKRTAVALNYCVDIFEQIGKLDYEEVNAESGDLFEIEDMGEFIQENVTTVNGTEIITGRIKTYNIELRIEDYKGGGIIKIITLKITYPVSRNNTEYIEMQRLKIIEN